MLQLARVLTQCARRAALPTVAPVYLGTALVAAILFGPQGMSAADAVAVLDASWPLRLGLWGAWLAATLPAARALFVAPTTFLLRALPVARWRFAAVHAAHLLLLDLAWIVLFARGGGPAAGLAAAATTVGAHALLCAGILRVPHGVAALSLVGTMVLARRLELPVALVATCLGVWTAFREAPEHPATRGRRAIRGPAAVALARCHLAGIWRRAPAAVARAIGVAATGAAITVLAAQSNGVVAATSLAALSLGVAAATITLAVGGINAAVLGVERAATWLLDTTGTTGRARIAAAHAAVALWGAGLGGLHGAGAALGLGATPALAVRLTAGGTAWGATVAAIAAAAARGAERVRARDRGTAAFGLSLVSAAGAATAAATLGELALAAGAAAALLAGAAQTGRAA